jgi:parvulin-like peptidyl-prolyl isomerase
MTLRSRPVLDRKHRPRWQDELRTQQLTIIGFAIAIAIAIGIFGAAAWNGYWETHQRPVAAVEGTTYNRSDLAVREQIVTAEAVAEATELNAQLGGPRDQIIQQQIDSISQRLNSLETEATASLVDSAVLAARADDFGLSVSESAVDAELNARYTLPERVAAQLILVNPLPEDAEPGAVPTEQQIAAARDEAQEARDRVEGGEDFATVASEVSDDFTAQTGGFLGWFEEDDVAYGEYFDALADADEGDLVGPVEVEGGFAVLQLVARREETQEGGLRDVLRDQGVDEADYRDYVEGELLAGEYQAYFEDEVVVSPSAQRRVAEIFIAPVSGAVVPQERGRHILVQPVPGGDAAAQAEATAEQWDAALEEARKVHELVSADDADWFALAQEYSDDQGSSARGGDLGWYDPTAPGFVTAFAATLAGLEVGVISEPIQTEFGWHVIQKTGERESPQAQAADLIEELRADPDSFAATATQVSEAYESADDGGEIGWIAPYELDRSREEAIFGLSEVGDITDPVETAEGISIYQLLEVTENFAIPEGRLAEIRAAGLERWLDEVVRDGVDTWIDPQFSTSTAV